MRDLSYASSIEHRLANQTRDHTAVATAAVQFSHFSCAGGPCELTKRFKRLRGEGCFECMGCDSGCELEHEVSTGQKLKG